MFIQLTHAGEDKYKAEMAGKPLGLNIDRISYFAIRGKYTSVWYNFKADSYQELFVTETVDEIMEKIQDSILTGIGQ